MVTLEDFLLFEMLTAGGGVAFSGTTVFFPTAILGAAVGRGPGTTWPIPPAGGFDTGTAVAGGGAENRPGGGLKAGRFGPAPSATLSLFLIAATCGAPAMAIAGGGAAAAMPGGGNAFFGGGYMLFMDGGGPRAGGILPGGGAPYDMGGGA